MNWWKVASGSMDKVISLPGCWYNPVTQDVVESRDCHACSIVKSPGRFGLTDDEVNAALMRSGQIKYIDDPEEKKAKLEKMRYDPEHAGIEDLHYLWKLAYDKGYIRMHKFENQVWGTHDAKPVLQLLADRAEPYLEKIQMLILAVNEKESFTIHNSKEARFFARYGKMMRRVGDGV